MLSNDILRHARELERAVRNNRYEVTEDGLLFPDQGLRFHGNMEHAVNGRDVRVDPNIVPIEAFNYLLTAGISNGTQHAAFYVALVGANVTPNSALTAATFDSVMTEFTNYDETARVEFVDSAASGGSLNNTASPALFTISAGGGTVYGGALLSAAAKESTAGAILACTLFASARVLLEADELSIKYTISGTSS